jgi:WD40 repeat protein
MTPEWSATGEIAALSPDGLRIVAASRFARDARVLDAVTGVELARLEGHMHTIRAASFSPDGTRIVTASHDNTARVWDAASGKELARLSGHTSEVNSASFSP